MVQETIKQLNLFPTLNKVQSLINSWDWKDSYSSFQIVKDEVIKPTFNDLRNKDYICRMNFRCCGTCATYDLSRMAKERNKIGIVYWHNQDQSKAINERLIYFGYKSIDQDEKDDITSRAVGNHLVESLQFYIHKSELPMIVSWNKDESTKILLEWKI